MASFNLKEVPPWGWLVAIGVGGYLYYTNRQNTTAASASSDTSSDSDVNTGNGAPIEILSDGSTDTSTTVPTYQTNEQWATAAINWLIAQGYSAALANSAITKGIAGGQDSSGNGMSASEYSLWSLALQHLGSPPEPVSVSPPTQASGPSGGSSGGGTSTTPPPTNPPPPAKTKVRYYTVKAWPAQGSTLWGIATIYYKDGSKWPTIYNANKKGIKRADGTPGIISNANLIHPGQKLIIP